MKRIIQGMTPPLLYRNVPCRFVIVFHLLESQFVAYLSIKSNNSLRGLVIQTIYGDLFYFHTWKCFSGLWGGVHLPPSGWGPEIPRMPAIRTSFVQQRTGIQRKQRNTTENNLIQRNTTEYNGWANSAVFFDGVTVLDLSNVKHKT